MKTIILSLPIFIGTAILTITLLDWSTHRVSCYQSLGYTFVGETMYSKNADLRWSMASHHCRELTLPFFTKRTFESFLYGIGLKDE